MSELNKDIVMHALSDIIDPELHIAIVDLGLIYDVKIKPGSEENKSIVEVDMTLTSPACPVGPSLRSAVHYKCAQLDGVEDAVVNLVFSPPWNPREHATEDAQMELGLI